MDAGSWSFVIWEGKVGSLVLFLMECSGTSGIVLVSAHMPESGILSLDRKSA